MEGTVVKGFVTMGGDQCGVEGPAVAMSSDASRDIELVCGNASDSNRSLLSYFSFERVLGEIVKARLKGKYDGGMLPPRRFWSRAGVKERIRSARGADPTVMDGSGAVCRTVTRSPKDIRREAIRRRVMKCWKEGSLDGQVWGAKLIAFIDGIQEKVRKGSVAFAEPKMIQIVKGVKDGQTEYRTVASFERLEDRVVLNLMTAYLRDRLEHVLSSSCYSFRRDGRIDHETALRDLQLWRKRHAAGEMFVGECDIRKFFDSISHEVVRRRWQELRLTLELEDEATAIVEAYLKAYSVGGSVEPTTLPKNDGVGLPQGGSLSTVLANLVLSAADARVLRSGDGELFYARYCDDVLFAHPDEKRCREAMESYEEELKTLGLPMHGREDFIYQREQVRCPPNERSYYEIKTKGPFRWAMPEIDERNVAPWVSFVGSQIRYDGETRIRKESVKKHARSLGRVTAAAVREIESWPGKAATVKEVFAWYSRFRNLLIRKGVGYVTAKIKDCDHCWAAAFGEVTKCEEARREMKYLDRIRANMLCKVAKLLEARGCEVVKGHRYKGNPFSYHAFLMKEVERPTSMRGKPKRRRGLLYSMM